MWKWITTNKDNQGLSLSTLPIGANWQFFLFYKLLSTFNDLLFFFKLLLYQSIINWSEISEMRNEQLTDPSALRCSLVSSKDDDLASAGAGAAANGSVHWTRIWAPINLFKRDKLRRSSSLTVAPPATTPIAQQRKNRTKLLTGSGQRILGILNEGKRQKEKAKANEEDDEE